MLPAHLELSCESQIFITLPAELIARLDRVDSNRSALLERAALAYLAEIEREEHEQKDLEIIGCNAKRLNREALDTLDYAVTTGAN